MFKPSENKQKTPSADQIRRGIAMHQKAIADLENTLVRQEAELNRLIANEAAPILADPRPTGLPYSDGDRLPVARFVVLDDNPARQRLEQDIRFTRGELLRLKQRVSLLRSTLAEGRE